MLTTPDSFLLLHLPNGDLQFELLHHFSKDGGETDLSVVPYSTS